jgi:hypothetical protein
VEGLRFPFFLAAWLLGALIVLIEFGTGIATSLIPENPPGIGIPYLALVDGILLFTLSLMGISLVVPANVVGRIQGCFTCLVSLVLVILGIVLILLAIVQLLLMIGLIASFFGILVYLAIWADFPHSAAAAILAFLLLIKVGVAVCLVLAHQRFIQNKGLVAIILTSLVANIVVSFLQALPPGILVSVTDTVAAIVVGVIAVIWAIILLISAIIDIVKILRVPKPPPAGPSGG